jgi:hypothetical protein
MTSYDLWNLAMTYWAETIPICWTKVLSRQHKLGKMLGDSMCKFLQVNQFLIYRAEEEE